MKAEDITLAHQYLDALGAPEDGLTIVQRLDALANPGTDDERQVAKAVLARGRIRGPMVDAILEPITKLAIPYAKLTEQQQRDFIASIRARVEAFLDRAVRVIMAEDLPTVTASLGDITVKKDTITGKFETPRTMTALDNLGRHGLKPIHIVLADPRLLDDGEYTEKVKPQPEQGRIDDLLDYPPDNSDLANAGDDEETSPTGDAAGDEEE